MLANSFGWKLRELDLAVLPAGADPIRVLHISDIHIAPGQRAKSNWIRGLAKLKPDLVVNTGDNLGHLNAIPTALEALAPLLDFPGVFVNGSNDYRSPTARNPLSYLWQPSEPRFVRDIDTESFTNVLEKSGWQNLNNRSAALELQGLQVGFMGLDDPHEELDDLRGLPAQRAQQADAEFVVGVAHAPYLRVIEGFCDAGAEVIFAGHTHGGQICLPSGRALTTNSDLPPKFAKGISAWNFAAQTVPLHVSAGIGTSIFAPVRLFCAPEATLLRLVAKRG